MGNVMELVDVPRQKVTLSLETDVMRQIDELVKEVASWPATQEFGVKVTREVAARVALLLDAVGARRACWRRSRLLRKTRHPKRLSLLRRSIQTLIGIRTGLFSDPMVGRSGYPATDYPADKTYCTHTTQPMGGSVCGVRSAKT